VDYIDELIEFCELHNLDIDDPRAQEFFKKEFIKDPPIWKEVPR
jgi:hypothetical protein